jgi:hypothetical protein
LIPTANKEEEMTGHSLSAYIALVVSIADWFIPALLFLSVWFVDLKMGGAIRRRDKWFWFFMKMMAGCYAALLITVVTVKIVKFVFYPNAV